MMKLRSKDFNDVTETKYNTMMGRCYQDTNLAYKKCGGLGVKVCSEWLKDINAFRTWVRNKISAQGISEKEFVLHSFYYQLDRIDMEGHYTPTNCKFFKPTDKRKAKRVVISAEGEEVRI